MTLSDDTEATLGLRDRKRQETRARLSEAAVYFVLRDGLEATTIDRIAERADVSRRTFFNYFESKEEALLVPGAREMDESVVAEHAARYASADVIESVVGQLFIIAAPSIADAVGNRQRAELLERHPQLLTKQFEIVHRIGERVASTTSTILASNPAWSGVDLDAGYVDVVLGACFSAMRRVLGPTRDGATTPTVDELEARCVDLVREVVERLR